MSATYPLTVIEEHGARPGLTGFVENVHAMIRVVAEEFGVPEMELTVALPPLAGFADADRAIQDCGRHVAAMWASLGVTGHLTEDDQLYISVN